MTKTGTDWEKGVYVRLDAEYPLSGVNYVMAGVAAEVLRRSLVESLDGTSLSVSVDCGFHSYPQERLWMQVNCQGPGARDALNAIHTGIRKASRAVSAKDLNAWKAMVLADISRELSEPATVVESVVARYGIGKDLVSHYKESVNDITAARLSDMLSSLSAGSAAEYIVE